MRILGLSMVLLGLGGCASLLSGALKEPKVELEKIEISDLGIREMGLKILLKVENPNGLDLTIEDLDYKIFLNEKELATQNTFQKTTVPAGGKSEVVLPMKVATTALWSSALSLLETREMKYRVEGAAHLPWVKVPFSKSGVLEIDAQ